MVKRSSRSKAQTFPASVSRKGNASTNPNRPLPSTKKAGFYRDKSKISLLNLYNSKPNVAKMRERPLGPARIQPDRRWFGNTRVITQSKLTCFREAMENARQNPFSVILKRSKLPVSLFSHEDTQDVKKRRADVLRLEPFQKTFGKKQTRKRPRTEHQDLGELVVAAESRLACYSSERDSALSKEDLQPKEAPSEEVYSKGTSRRIWQELYKVVDSADILIQVIDARDPMGTRCRSLEQRIRKDRPNKHIILLLNKCDLVPAWCASLWIKVLSSEFPTVAFHSSLNKPFGKLTLLNLLRQYAGLLKERKHVSVGFFGYPNVGKSSIINTLRRKKVCKVAPVPGETKIWQYVALTHRVYLIDCPGVVPADSEAGDETAKVLKGVVRAEKIVEPEHHIHAVLKRATKEDLLRRYKLAPETHWEGAEDFLDIIARKMGRLRKGGEPDIATAARVVLYDWQRGKIPFFIRPPEKPAPESTSSHDNITSESVLAA